MGEKIYSGSGALILFFVLILSSCIPNKRIVYLQEPDKEVAADTIYPMQKAKYRLQVNDIIKVEIRIPMAEEKINASLNLAQGNQNMNMSGGAAGDFFYLFGYTLDDSGYVNLPLLGQTLLVGQTIEEATATVKQEVSKHFKDPYVVVRLGGLRFSVLGEANNPGKFVILQNQVTIFEAIATAGDLRSIAKRDEVTLVRQYPEGSRIHKINLLDEDILSSPYYFIQPNDILYIEPMKMRVLGTGETFLPTLAAVLGTLSSTLLIIQFLNR